MVAGVPVVQGLERSRLCWLEAPKVWGPAVRVPPSPSASWGSLAPPRAPPGLGDGVVLSGATEKGHAVRDLQAPLCTSPAWRGRFRSQIKAQRSEVEVLLAGCREWAFGPEGLLPLS